LRPVAALAALDLNELGDLLAVVPG